MSSSLEQLTRPIEGQKVFVPELPDYHALRHCIRCARCLPACPTYQETGLEMQSPRGRLALIKAVEDGYLPMEAEVEAHLYHCLDCRMCNTVCPPAVPIGQSIVAARAAFARQGGRPWWSRLAFERVLISPRRLGRAMLPLRLYQWSGLRLLVRPLLYLLPGPLARLRHMERLLPRLPVRPLHKRLKVVTPARGEAQYRVGFFLGCMMSQIFARESRATVEVLRRAGCEVVTPREQVCCGAPQDDQGLRARVRQLARQNIALFEQAGQLDVIVSDCAACSGMLKEYAELLHDDPEFADRARAFSAKIQDIYEWYDRVLPPVIGSPSAEPTPVTLHDACHLANVQGVTRPQRRLLKRIPSVRLVEMAEPGDCCGSAGIYNITHPEMANKRLARKMKHIAATRAPVVLTNGPGCLLQLRAAARKRGVRIRHISELVEEVMNK